MKALSRTKFQVSVLSLAAFVTVAVFLQLLHARPRSTHLDRQLLSDSGKLAAIQSVLKAELRQPLLIPRIIHQTQKTSVFSEEQQKVLQSWKTYNPTWDVQFYDDADCLSFVRREFPQWLGAYEALPMAVERADFFRYMVILRHGGVYADVDTECGMALDELILPDDSFLAGWEDEYATVDQAVIMSFARQRQMEQWVFAAAPGHPILQALCELVASMAFEPVRHHRIDALFRTGPAPFTDVVLRHAFRHPLHLKDDPYRLRILPRVVFGGLPPGSYGVSTWREPKRLVRHLSVGSWKSLDFQFASSEVEKQHVLSLMRAATTVAPNMLYPVSTATQPPFTVMTHLLGRGDEQAGADVAAQVTRWGTVLAPGGLLLQKSPLDVFMDSWRSQDCSGKVLLDIGAGLGTYSLAAAAQGLFAETFELSPRSLASLEASIDYNGFSNRINLHKVALGMWNEELCMAAGPGFTPWDSLLSGRERPCTKALRGYGKLHTPQATRACHFTAARRTPEALNLEELDIGAVRISVSGWEGWVLGSLKEVLLLPSTTVVLLELYPQLLPVAGFRLGWQSLLEQLQIWGFTNISHVGPACIQETARPWWMSSPDRVFFGLFFRRVRERTKRQPALEPGFEWCSYSAQRFKRSLTALPSADVPELFLLRK